MNMILTIINTTSILLPGALHAPLRGAAQPDLAPRHAPGRQRYQG